MPSGFSAPSGGGYAGSYSPSMGYGSGGITPVSFGYGGGGSPGSVGFGYGGGTTTAAFAPGRSSGKGFSSGGSPMGTNFAEPTSGSEGAWQSGYGPNFNTLMENAYNEQAAITGAFPVSPFQYSPMKGEWGLTQHDPSAEWQTMTGDNRTGKTSWWSAPMDLLENISEYEIGSPFGSEAAGETIGTLLGIEGGDVSTVGDYAKTAMMLANPGMLVANKLWSQVGDVASGFQDAGSNVGQPGLMNLSSPEAQTGLMAGDVGGMSASNIANQPRTIRDVDVESMEQTYQNEYDAYMKDYTDYMNSILVEAQPEKTKKRTPMQTSSAWLTAENPMRGLGGIYG